MNPAGRKDLLQVVLLLVLVQACLGGNFVVMKLALETAMDPVVLSFFRDVGGSFVLLAAARLFDQFVVPRYEDLIWFVLLGVFGIFIGQMFMLLALQYVDTLTAARQGRRTLPEAPPRGAAPRAGPAVPPRGSPAVPALLVEGGGGPARRV